MKISKIGKNLLTILYILSIIICFDNQLFVFLIRFGLWFPSVYAS